MRPYEYPYEKRVWGFILENKAKKNRDKIYLHFKDREITYQETNEYANRLANGFLSLGVKRGDRVSVMLPNLPEFLFTWFSLARLGAVDSPINTAYKGDLLRHVITNSSSKILLIHEEFLERIILIQSELPTLEKIIIYPKVKTKPDLKFPILSFEELLQHPSEFNPPEEVRPSDPLQIIYTSGTTGPSKGVVLSHHCVYCYAIDCIRFIGFNERDITYNCLPLFHQNHRFTSTYTLLNDTSYAMGERFSASAFWNEIRRYKATAFHFLGGMANFLYNQPTRVDDAENLVRLAWGGPVSLELAKAFEKRFNLRLYLGFYGLTEASGVTFLSAEDQDRLKAKGKWEKALGAGKENKDLY